MIQRLICIRTQAALLCAWVFILNTGVAMAALDEEKQRRFSPTEWYLEDLKTAQFSHIPRKDIVNENLDWSYITFGAGYHINHYMSPRTIYYEAEINNSLNWREWYSDKYFLSVDVPIRLSIRQFNVDSSPVRTPSFNPGLRFTYYSKNPASPAKGFNYFTFGLHHYSNGQDNISVNDDGSINTRNGSFSTDYLEFAYHRVADFGAFNWLRISVREHANLTWEAFQSKQYETGAVKLQIKTKRFITPFPIIHWRWPTSVQLVARYSYSGRDYIVYNPEKPALNRKAEWDDNVYLATEIVLSPPIWKSMSWYVRYDYGYDYYNINFQNRMNRIQVGLTGHSFDFLSGKGL